MDLKKKSNGDINSLEDRLWAIANTVSIEEHAISSYLRTNDVMFLNIAKEFREIRKSQMEYILGKEITEHPAEIWCMTKHALAAAMRYSEVASRYTEGDLEHCRMCLEDSKKCVNLLLMLIGIAQNKETTKLYKDISEESNLETHINQQQNVGENTQSIGFFSRLKTAVLSCCKE